MSVSDSIESYKMKCIIILSYPWKWEHYPLNSEHLRYYISTKCHFYTQFYSRNWTQSKALYTTFPFQHGGILQPFCRLLRGGQIYLGRILPSAVHRWLTNPKMARHWSRVFVLSFVLEFLRVSIGSWSESVSTH